MKSAPGQPADVPEPADDTVPAPPTPPRGRPVSAYAAILDGQTLWLAIDPAPGSLALRHTTSGEVVVLRSDLAEDNPAYRSIRADLTDIIDQGDHTYECVLVPPDGGEPLPVWTHPLPATRPVHTPPARDGVTQYDVRRADDGTLQIHRSRLSPAAELRAISVEGSTIHISVGAYTATGALLMLNKADELLASFPLTGGDGVLRAIIHRDELPAGVGRFARMVVGAAESWVPIRRRHNDLSAPNGSVQLPQLFADDSDRPRLTFHFNPQAQLTARLLDPDDTNEDEAHDEARDNTDEGDDA